MDIAKYKIFDKHEGIIKLSNCTNKGHHNTEISNLMDEGYVEK